MGCGRCYGKENVVKLSSEAMTSKQGLVEFLLHSHSHCSIVIKGGRSHYTNTSEPVVRYGATDVVTDQFGIRNSDLSVNSLTR
jgi:hypothetical protein